MLIRLKSLQDRVRSSLFIVPVLFILGAVALGELMLVADEVVDVVPSRLTATVDSARSVLSVVAGATLAFAGIAFSVSLLLISLASSQYSPRVVHGLFRDPFNTRVMGIVVGTFTYCLVVMRAVRGPLEETGQAVVPSLSILLAVVLGVASIMSIVAFINHAAHSMDVSKILHRVTKEATERVRKTWPELSADDTVIDVRPPAGAGFGIVFDREGWVQSVDHEALLTELEPGSCMALDTTAGRYAIPNTPMATVWPVPTDRDAAIRLIRGAVMIGETRTMQQDVAYGLRQLADVALKALSPGINDPTTAQDALFHLGAVLGEMLGREAPARRLTGREGQVLLFPQAPTHEELVDLSFDEVRIASAGQPAVTIYLLEIIHLLTVSLTGRESPAVRAALRRQADLLLQVSELADLADADHDRVRAAHRDRFLR